MSFGVSLHISLSLHTVVVQQKYNKKYRIKLVIASFITLKTQNKKKQSKYTYYNMTQQKKK